MEGALHKLPAWVPRALGRYEVLGGLGQGGMASVYLGRAAGESGFQRLVAIKVLHPHLSEEASFVAMLLDEARIAARLHHPNVVPVVDQGTHEGLHYVVMDWVDGCSLFELLAKHKDERPPRLIVPLVLDALAGLHAAHELRGDDGASLELVHRDVSPQNVLVGVDGVARITDFGVARAAARITSTQPGAAHVKGRVGFLSPEQLRGAPIDRRSDVFAAGVMLWSALTGKRLFFDPSSEAATMTNTLEMPIARPSEVGLRPPPAFDEVCLRALERDPEKRFASALEMEDALRAAATEAGMLGTRAEIAVWMEPARRAATLDARSRGEDTPATLAAAPSPSGARKWLALAAAAIAFALTATLASLALRNDAPPRSTTLPPQDPARATATATATATAPPTATVTATPPPTVTAPTTVVRAPAHHHPVVAAAHSAPAAALVRWDENSPVPPP